MTQYQLTMQSGPTPGKVFPLEGDNITIGREPDNGVAIADQEVSRKHSRLVMQNGQYVISDLGSTNGTFVNGTRVDSEHVLASGEIISLSEQINLLFEAIVPVVKADPNATMMSPGRVMASPPPPMSIPAPTPEPEPTPVTASAPVFTPASAPAPAPSQAAKAPAKAGGNQRTILIIAAVVVLCLACCCLSYSGYYIYSNHMFGL